MNLRQILSDIRYREVDGSEEYNSLMQEGEQAIKQWVLDEVIGEDEEITCSDDNPCIPCIIAINNNYHKEHMRRKVEEA